MMLLSIWRRKSVCQLCLMVVFSAMKRLTSISNYFLRWWLGVGHALIRLDFRSAFINIRQGFQQQRYWTIILPMSIALLVAASVYLFYYSLYKHFFMGNPVRDLGENRLMRLLIKLMNRRVGHSVLLLKWPKDCLLINSFGDEYFLIQIPVDVADIFGRYNASLNQDFN